MPVDEIEYFRERAAAELRMAAEASRQDVAAIHEELARQYQGLVDQSELRPKLRIVVGNAPATGGRKTDDGPKIEA